MADCSPGKNDVDDDDDVLCPRARRAANGKTFWPFGVLVTTLIASSKVAPRARPVRCLLGWVTVSVCSRLPGPTQPPLLGRTRNDHTDKSATMLRGCRINAAGMDHPFPDARDWRWLVKRVIPLTRASILVQESCAIAKMTARCADKSKQTKTATPPPKIT